MTCKHPRCTIRACSIYIKSIHTKGIILLLPLLIILLPSSSHMWPVKHIDEDSDKNEVSNVFHNKYKLIFSEAVKIIPRFHFGIECLRFECAVLGKFV